MLHLLPQLCCIRCDSCAVHAGADNIPTCITCRYELEDETVSWGRESFDDANVIPTDQLKGLRTDELANVVGEFADPGGNMPLGD